MAWVLARAECCTNEVFLRYIQRRLNGSLLRFLGVGNCEEVEMRGCVLRPVRISAGAVTLAATMHAQGAFGLTAQRRVRAERVTACATEVDMIAVNYSVASTLGPVRLRRLPFAERLLFIL